MVTVSKSPSGILFSSHLLLNARALLLVTLSGRCVDECFHAPFFRSHLPLNARHCELVLFTKVSELVNDALSGPMPKRNAIAWV
jgi:hypothetical protein